MNKRKDNSFKSEFNENFESHFLHKTITFSYDENVKIVI